MPNTSSDPNHRPATMSPRQLKVIKTVLIGSAIISLPITLYWRWHFSGLFKILADIDIKIFGSYRPASTTFFTFLLLFLAIVLPILILYRLVYGGDKVVSPEAERQAVPVKDVIQRTQDITHLMTRTHRYVVAAIAAGVILVGVGINKFWQGNAAGTLTSVTTETLLDGTEPSSRYIQISGIPAVEKGVIIKETNQADVYYVPLYDENNKQKPVLILKSTNQEFPASGFIGVLSRPIDGFARDEFITDGVVVDDGTWVLDIDNSPGSLKVLGIVSLVGGVFLSVGGYVVFRRKSKKVENS